MPDTLAATPDSAPGQSAHTGGTQDSADFSSAGGAFDGFPGVDDNGFLSDSPMSQSFAPRDTPSAPADGPQGQAAGATAQTEGAADPSDGGEGSDPGQVPDSGQVPWHKDKRWQEWQQQRADLDRLKQFEVQVQQHFAQQQQIEQQRQLEQAVAERQAQLQQAVDLGQITEEFRDHIVQTERAAQQAQQYQQVLARQMQDAEVAKSRETLSALAPFDTSAGTLPNGAPLTLDAVLRVFPPHEVGPVTNVLKAFVDRAVEQGVAKRLAEQQKAPAPPVAGAQQAPRPQGAYRPGNGFSSLWGARKG